MHILNLSPLAYTNSDGVFVKGASLDVEIEGQVYRIYTSVKRVLNKEAGVVELQQTFFALKQIEKNERYEQSAEGDSLQEVLQGIQEDVGACLYCGSTQGFGPGDDGWTRCLSCGGS